MYQSGNEHGNYENQITNGGNSFILREYLNFDRFEMNANGDCELHTMIDERGPMYANRLLHSRRSR